MTKIAVVIVAAGRGSRARVAGKPDRGPKQYRKIGGRAIIAQTLAAFAEIPEVSVIQPVIHADDHDMYDEALSALSVQERAPVLPPVNGGETRQASVYEGLKSLASQQPDLVLVHDAVRPFVSAATINRTIDGLSDHKAILPALPVVDTIKRTESTADLPVIVETVDRSALYAAQTPQAFHFLALYSAHQEAAGQAFTDDCAVMEWAGHKVHIVAGNSENKKITTAEDIREAERQMASELQMETRVGNGFDVHAFEEGNAVILGGVEIPHSKKLKGHSDADVGLHTITDALYGALADGDIGSHFPPSDPKWKGAASDIFLIHACERVRERDGKILHLDLTIMCEAPKIGPYREAIRSEIARICSLPLSRVAVKATTTERLGFTGREEGIAAMATATIAVPAED